ncbi:MAG: DUF502 domain-containing protein [Chloroflexi bacterium]|nr:DUF502 domain-containing protein [Chloroflexota bacterium]
MGKKLRMYFLAGILVVVPLTVTILILVWIFSTIDNILQPIITVIVGHSVPGIGFGVALILIYLIGALVSNVGGKKLLEYSESLLARVPLVRPLYATIKQILESFSVPGEGGLGQTALVEFPRNGVWAVGFITKETQSQSGETWLSVFIPNAPNPTSGFLRIIKEGEAIRTNISANDALCMIISAGKVSCDEIGDILSERPK